MTANDAENCADSLAEETQRERAAGRTPASENPWYLLATVAGEQSEDEFDEERHARNLRFWNGWACQNLSDEQRHELAADARIEAANLARWNAEERELVEDTFRRRQLKIPSVEQRISLQSTFFSQPVVMQSFIFPSSISSNCSKFARIAFFKNSVFINAAEFEQAVFIDLILSGTKFGDSVRFTDACIKRSWDFSTARFFGQTNLDQMELLGGVHGEDAEFHGITSLKIQDISAVLFLELMFLMRYHSYKRAFPIQ